MLHRYPFKFQPPLYLKIPFVYLSLFAMELPLLPLWGCFPNLCGEFSGTCLFEIRISRHIHRIIVSRQRKSIENRTMHIPRLWIRAAVLLGIALLLYVFVFSSGYQKYQIEGIIKRSEPEKVWEYVADFNKMRLLNPTMWVYHLVWRNPINIMC